MNCSKQKAMSDGSESAKSWVFRVPFFFWTRGFSGPVFVDPGFFGSVFFWTGVFRVRFVLGAGFFGPVFWVSVRVVTVLHVALNETGHSALCFCGVLCG